MNLDIGRLAVTLLNVPPDLGGQVAGALEAALHRQLSALRLDGGGRDTASLDLGVIDAPAGCSVPRLTDLIAARLVDRIGHDTPAVGAPAAAGEDR